MKLKVLITDDNEDIRDFIMAIIESIYECDFVEASDAKMAIEQFKKHKSQFDIILCDYNMPKANGSVFYQYLLDNNIQTPYIHISSEKVSSLEGYDHFEDYEFNKSLLKPFTVDKLESIILTCLKITMDKEKINDKMIDKSGYNRISTKRLIQYSKHPIDVFIKISKDKYVKVLNCDDIYDPNVLNKYVERSVDYVFLKNSDYDELLNTNIRELLNSLLNSKLSDDQKIYLQSRSLEEIQACALRLGVTKNVIELTDKLCSSIIKTVNDDNDISEYIKKLIKNEGYVFELSHLMNYLCVAVANIMELSPENINKLLKASIFCNIAISNKLAQYQFIDDEKYYKLSLDEREQIKKHISMALEILDKSKEFLGDERSIVENHHEKPDGKGFPRKLDSSQIPILCALFNMCHDFCHLILIEADIEKIDPQVILNRFDDDYQKGSYLKPYEALVDIIK